MHHQPFLFSVHTSTGPSFAGLLETLQFTHRPLSHQHKQHSFSNNLPTNLGCANTSGVAAAPHPMPHGLCSFKTEETISCSSTYLSTIAGFFSQNSSKPQPLSFNNYSNLACQTPLAFSHFNRSFPISTDSSHTYHQAQSLQSTIKTFAGFFTSIPAQRIMHSVRTPP